MSNTNPKEEQSTNVVIPAKKTSHTLDEIKDSAEAMLKKEPTNATFRLRLKDCINYIKKSKESIKETESLKEEMITQQKQYGEHIKNAIQRESKAKESQDKLQEYEKRLLLNTDRIALEICAAIVQRTTGIAQRPRPIQEIMAEIKEIMPDILSMITPQEETEEEVCLDEPTNIG